MILVLDAVEFVLAVWMMLPPLNRMLLVTVVPCRSRNAAEPSPCTIRDEDWVAATAPVTSTAAKLVSVMGP